MSSPARYQPLAQPPVRSTTSQATQIEQSRAVAEVQAAVLVAQQNPRNKSIAVSEMRDSTAQKSVAEKAFFSFPRGGQTVSGPSIHIARELARCWGNMQYGLAELRRDDDKGESEMQAFAWDLETNARNTSTFIVPHKRDKTGGPVKLTDMREIYENNANSGARRVRECIFAILPSWFVDEAEDRCREALQDGGGVPLATRIANSIQHFENAGVSRKQLEAKVGSSSSEWSENDLTELGITFTSMRNGEITRDEAFPPVKLSAAEIKADRAAAPADSAKGEEATPTEPPEDDGPVDGPITEKHGRELAEAFKSNKLTRWADRLKWLRDNSIIGKQEEPENGIAGLSDAQAVVALDVFDELAKVNEPANGGEPA
ncbi:MULTISPECIES: hypothetical protein [unclassified Rhodococcus (in: high G+C Gram-positive bacteria)]|uniref:hypothetical protein n=1 Tax=unclassified Rhodococcus (in: high G+C Gram-positive bacteria) TaxID=192944 RepID=UPI001C3DE092|nr:MULTISPECIES: hypothetical protein [unclassified Rhodococcus (in: high G+C Gram-positive bacteria)]